MRSSRPIVVTAATLLCASLSDGAAGVTAWAATAATTATAAPPGTPGDDYVTYSGTATALRTDKFLYREQHFLSNRDGKLAERLVLYSCRNGAPFARKIVSDVDPLVPDFVLEDTSNGMREGIRSNGNGREVFFRAATNDAEKAAPLPKVSGLVADSGFDEFVHVSWESLTSGKSVYLHFLIPSRLDDMGFKIDPLRSDQIDGVPVQVFRLKLSGILGWFLPGIDTYYGAQDHRLMHYVGLSDLRDTAGDNFKVDIQFDPKDRKPASNDDVEKARAAPLAPCTKEPV
jgi:hypothetical protein